MHYKNGRPASEGDSVIGETYKGSGIMIAGKLHSLNANCDCISCNAQLAFPTIGGMSQACVTVGELYFAADAFAAIEATMAGSPAVPVPPGGFPTVEAPKG